MVFVNDKRRTFEYKGDPMKKSTKRILLTVGVVLLLFVSYVGMRLYHILSDIKQMTPLETGQIIAGVFAVKDSYVNLYLVKAANGYIAIDSGISPESVGKELQKLGINPTDVAAVFLTHGDSDHTGGLGVFQNAKIYLGADEEQMIDGRTARFAFIKNKPIAKHDLLSDNQDVDINGLMVTAIFTPGHTPGSTCYRVGGQYLFIGDSMRLREGKADIFSKAINMDSDTQHQSLKKLARLNGVKYIFTAHFGYANDFDRAFSAMRN
jgi:hydroxyacylglutathione hydrolase